MTKSHFAAAALVAALSFPAFASDAPRCEVCGDEHLAPAFAVNGTGAEGEALAADPTWPGTEHAAPAVALTRTSAPLQLDGPQEWAPAAQYALEVPAKAAPQQIAQAR